MIETAAFVCSICNEPSMDICVRCTKDACPNHRCARCKECSDCCECEVPLTEPEPDIRQRAEVTEATHVPNEPDMFLLPPEASEEPDLNVPRNDQAALTTTEDTPVTVEDAPASAEGAPTSADDAPVQHPEDHKQPEG